MTARDILQATVTELDVRAGDLRVRSVDVDEFGAQLHSLIDDLRDTLWSYSICVGLAAPQIGVAVRVAIANPARRARDDDLVLVNPTLVRTYGKKDVKRESCMSLWGVHGEVERRTRVVVQYATPLGDTLEIEREGFDARVIMHEIDHLDGILYCDRLRLGSKLSSSAVFAGHARPRPDLGTL